MLLTTHYLEEAEALCGRIAMLKQGRVVALDRTANLLAGTASTMLRFKTDDALPAAAGRRMPASPGASCSSRRTTRPRSKPCWASCAQAGVRVEDLEIGRADLEDVFLEIMQDTRRAQRGAKRATPGQRVPRSGAAMIGFGRAHAVLQGDPALLEGRLPDRGRAGAHRDAVPADLRPCARGPGAGLPRRGLHQLPDPGPGDDERAAERLCQQLAAR